MICLKIFINISPPSMLIDIVKINLSISDIIISLSLKKLVAIKSEQ